MAAIISFYGGVNEIGDNKILIQDGETRVFFDFGKNFTREGLYFEEPLKTTSYKRK